MFAGMVELLEFVSFTAHSRDLPLSQLARELALSDSFLASNELVRID
jgi:hypothetical protein